MCHALAGQMEQLDNRAEVHGTAMITEQHIVIYRGCRSVNRPRQSCCEIQLDASEDEKQLLGYSNLLGVRYDLNYSISLWVHSISDVLDGAYQGCCGSCITFFVLPDACWRCLPLFVSVSYMIIQALPTTLFIDRLWTLSI